MKTLAAILIVAAIVIAIVSFWYINSGSNIIIINNNNTSNQTNISENPNPQTYDIKIQYLEFVPSLMKIKAGDTIKWTNKDSVKHTITSDSGNELDSSQLSNNQTYSHTFNKAGNYSYHCSIHTMMKAKIIVE